MFYKVTYPLEPCIIEYSYQYLCFVFYLIQTGSGYCNKFKFTLNE